MDAGLGTGCARARVSADLAGDLGELMCAELDRLRTNAAHR
jgi:hypothetical protein